MNNLLPTLAEWKSLYEAAIEFKKIESWHWMGETEIFGVQNPEDGEIGYCMTLGSNGEVFALAVYLGTDGLEGMLKIQSGEVGPEGLDALHAQKCLMASFENRDCLQKADLQIIKELGLKFRGRHEWPLFRSYEPGFFPWYLSKSEVRFLTLALEQACQVSLRVKDNPDLLLSSKENQYFVRVPEKIGRDIVWHDQWLVPEPLEKKERKQPVLDELYLRRLKDKTVKQDRVLEADLFYAPFPVQEKKNERPYYPYVSLWLDQHSGEILNYCLSPHSDYRADFCNSFLKLIENIRVIPRAVTVAKIEVAELLEPLARKLGTEIKLVKRFKVLEGAKESLFEYLG
ncbi:DUF7309 domain-containing protein [Zhaonella formicivorans]|uniref:DUF7309 domain-containing protein n=1 Tax=Zhaonella formicivorans TaxID=2528593 RepID=UPI0010DBBAC8|nr:hypothetical protein [Zhaonella formicivorans]